MPQKDPSKTEEATPKRRNKAREEGNVPKSQELSKVIGLVGGIIALRLTFPYIRDSIMETIDWFLSQAVVMQFNEETVYELFLFCAIVMGKIVLPVMIFILIFTIAIMIMQVGPLWTLKPLKPKLKVFNIVEGLKKKMFDLKTLVRLVRNVFQAAAVAVAPYIVLKLEFANLLPLFYASPAMIGGYILNTGFKMALFALVPLLIIAIADVVYTRWDYNENLKMTKDEVKDERKQAEGDPKVKQQQRQKMLGVTQQRMMQDVPKADVVITNPTHIAIAIKYDPAAAPAPMVLAKGVNHLAEKIKAAARQNNIPIRENKPLAQALYKSVEVGQTIPEELYKAVAAVLAEIYKIKGR
ncbi:flagellar biosynthesis protein FlhB [Desulfonatronovibrio magnus]|uniref:flagellar biosynthesis protein FlhB n=1 Tax=Desulfonatronovibrio magnus TaxID=698827 RepID=UPI0005EBED06|nr:flagellar biosynthesis protein FlhB [Desulfonatronovibrio magnus]